MEHRPPGDERNEKRHGDASLARLRARYGVDVDPEVRLQESADDAAAHSGEQAGPMTSTLDRLGAHAAGSSRYRLEGEIARGGMGAILEVWDEDLRRRLAMKVALDKRGTGPGSSASDLDPRILARFLEEAQITGQLEHPGIVPVHELGIDDEGQVFFTMRLVRGRDLEVIFGYAAAGYEGWTTTRALGVLLKACEALAFAHSKGVVHRDLKPANVMVGRFGEVYVMDWGLARIRGQEDRHDLRVRSNASDSVDWLATDPRLDATGGSSDHLYTMDGDVLGTPAFMSPEQARGELELLDERADVYSFGAMLYRLLGETAPYVAPGGSRSAMEILNALLEGPPPALETLAPSVPVELIAITEKAMARDADARYPNMLALADDLRAYLENRVVGAYETGAIAEARKWVRRNKPLAAALAAGVLALVGGLSASLILKQRSDANALLAETRRGDAEESARLAEMSRAEAATSAERARREARISNEVNSFLNEDLLSSVAPEHAGVDVTVREVLDAASLRLDGRFVDEPLVESELRLTIGTSYERLGEYERALRQAERALALNTSELGPDAQPTLAAVRLVGLAHLGLRDTAAAEEYLERVLTGFRATLGEEHEDTLAARCDVALAIDYSGRSAEARVLYEALLADQQRLLGPDHPETLTTANNLAIALQQLGEFEAAEQMQRATLATLRTKLPAEHPQVVDAINNLALVCMERGDYPESERLYEESIALRTKSHGAEHPDTVTSRTNLGLTLLLQGQTQRAEREFRTALTVQQRELGPDHPLTMKTRGALVTVLSSRGRHEEALELQRELVDTLVQRHGRMHPEVLREQSNLAGVLRDLKRLDEAEELFRATHELNVEVIGLEHPSSLVCWENLAGVLYQQGALDECEEITLAVLEVRRGVLGDEHPDVAKTTYNVGMIRKSRGDESGAREMFEEALRRNRLALGDDHPNVADSLGQLAGLELDFGDYSAAIERFREAIRIRRTLGSDDATVGYWLHQTGYALLKQGEYDAAIEVLEETLALRRPLGGDRDAGTLATIHVLAEAYLKAEDFETAEALALEYARGSRGNTRDLDQANQALVKIYEAWGRPEEADPYR